VHNLRVPNTLQFPQLSRKPALNTQGTLLDPTLRDSYENGMEATRARYSRPRRQWDVSIKALTPDDVDTLQDFVTNVANFGAVNFTYTDERDPRNPRQYNVRFSSLPKYTDGGNIKGVFCQDCTFQIREV
jgi:hypothetical protein